MTSRYSNISPEHDSAVGLIHPYWARKPLNIIQELVLSYSNPGDVILDPFVGSGTTIFAALSENRRVIGTDINPLSIFLIESIISLGKDNKKKISVLNEFVNEISKKVMPWFQYDDDLYIERERFSVEGSYENGDFELFTTEVVLKKLNGEKYSGRVVINDPEQNNSVGIPKKLLNSPIEFDKIEMLPNSRIAIPKGARLGHYFDKRNRATINYALQIINRELFGKENSGILKFLISSSIPLLRLTDKKATSQWPYWRPKKSLTTRNPIFVFKKKIKLMENAGNWIKEYYSIDSYDESFISTYCVPIQKLIPNYVKQKSIDLIITDPPYSHQVPYLEYSNLWFQILDIPKPLDAYEFEIVQTDAPQRIEDSKDYKNRFIHGIKVCSDVLKENGNLILFYQDQDLQNWAWLENSLIENQLEIEEVISFPKQRRSLKTITTPGKTLDGDLALILRKNTRAASISITTDQFIRILSEEFEKEETQSYYKKYSIIIMLGLKYHFMSQLSKKTKYISEFVKSKDL